MITIIPIPTLERFLATSCFCILFLTTVYYWFRTIFVTEACYKKTGLVGFLGAGLCLTLHLLLRWFDSGHFPLSNLYESLLFLAWCFILLHCFLENAIKTLFLGVLTSPLLLCLVAFTDFSLPPELQRSSALVPALQSNWLVMHVTVMIASYAALLLGCLMAIAYLIFSSLSWFSTNQKSLDQENMVTRSFAQNEVFGVKNDPTNVFLAGGFKNEVGPSTWGEVQSSKETGFSVVLENKKDSLSNSLSTTPFLMFLDNVSYRTIGIGFCFLTLGILSGAVWANETWGNYWSWDPKETWALLTWLTFATYLHSRLVGGWTGSKSAVIAVLGFFVVWICYLGVNLLGQGLHSYGFLQT
jgi:cytochrome c-type biogenesis protein CcsB